MLASLLLHNADAPHLVVSAHLDDIYASAYVPATDITAVPFVCGNLPFALRTQPPNDPPGGIDDHGVARLVACFDSGDVSEWVWASARPGGSRSGLFSDCSN